MTLDTHEWNQRSKTMRNQSAFRSDHEARRVREGLVRPAPHRALCAAAAIALASAAAHAALGPCRQTAQELLRACQADALSAYHVALGKCANLTSPGARRSCQDDAAGEQVDALDSCDDSFEARQAVCVRLGDTAYDPRINPSNFTAVIDNPYFPLRPGTTYVYEGRTADGLEHSTFAVTHNTRVIDGVTCVEVRDTVLIDGEVREDTLDWFAQDRDGNVWYFGENTHELEDGLIATIDGSFRAAVEGDKPGIIMRAHPAIGDFYRQEFSLANAEDFAEVVGLDESVTVPAGSFAHCLRTRETTPLEPDLLEDKVYAPGIGSVLTVDVTTGARLERIRIETE